MKRGLLGLLVGLLLATAASVGAQWQGGWNTLGYLATPLRWYAGTGPAITPGTGTAVVVNEAAIATRAVYKVTVGYQQFTSLALTHDVTLATLPAKVRLVSIVADLTQTFSCASTPRKSWRSLRPQERLCIVPTRVWPAPRPTWPCARPS